MRTALIVDPSPAAAHRADVALAACGFECVHTPTCDEGLRAALADRPDLIIVDVFAPEMDGFALTRTLSRDLATREIPVLMTGYPSYGAQRFKALWNGARDFLPNSLDADDLADAARALTDHPLPAATVAY